jgi:hypothetical protein
MPAERRFTDIVGDGSASHLRNLDWHLPLVDRLLAMTHGRGAIRSNPESGDRKVA